MGLAGYVLTALFIVGLVNTFLRPPISIWLVRRSLRRDPTGWLLRRGRKVAAGATVQTMWVQGTLGGQGYIHLPVVVAVLTHDELFVESEASMGLRRDRFVVPSGTPLKYDRHGVVQLPRQDHAIGSAPDPDELIAWLRAAGWTLSERELDVPGPSRLFRPGGGREEERR